MSKITKPIALDETVQLTNNKLDDLKTAETTGLGNVKSAIEAQTTAETTGLGNVKSAVEAQTAQQQADMSQLLNQLIGVLASVKSVNGKYGIVVLDSGDILISKSTTGSKTVKQMMTEMQTAISKTPLTFTAEAISGSTDDFNLVVTQGTPT